ncbi:MAG: methyltransferase [Pseudomonadales bacterium]|jgi:hypothetical protein|nr:methyltransferase [Pseudomonadales bacterium]
MAEGAGVWDATGLSERLAAVAARLEADAPLWRAQPFKDPAVPWTAHAPELAAALLALDEATLEVLETDPQALLERLGAVDERFRIVRDLTALPVLPARALPAPGPFADRHVPGRKWAQLLAFAGALPETGARVVDWCAGKGHLGRLLADAGAEVRCIEHDAALCAAGRALADARPLRFEHRDVLDPTLPLAADEHVVALHACGVLHERLLARARHERFAVSVAPCCYHRLAAPDATWAPMSRTGPATGLSRDDLRLAVAGVATAPRHVRRLRERERVYRTAFDLLQREVSGEDRYRPVRSVPGSVLSAGFGAFSAFAADHLGLPLPPETDLEPWLRRGAERERRVRRLDLVRLAYGRLLELRVVLDRALALAEAGHRVTLGVFCPRTLTPRNLLLHAVP